MTKKNQKTLATIMLIVGGYLIYKKMYAKKPESNTGSNVIPSGTGAGTGSAGTGAGTSSGIPSGYTTYVVNTASGNLNVRSTPSASGTIVEKYPKGKEFVGAYFSGYSGWVEVVRIVNGKPERIGYVSSQFVKPKI